MFLATRPSGSSLITTRLCLIHSVWWFVSSRQASFSAGGDNATTGAQWRLSELFRPARTDTTGVIMRALECGRWSESVELELEGLHVELDPFIVNRVLRGLSDSEMAVRFYWWAESRPGFDHNQFSIAYIISLLFVHDNFALLSEFLGTVRSQGVIFHRSLYRILSGYVRAGKLDSVIEMFDDMVTSGCREFGVEYNRFIGVLVKNCCFDSVDKYYSMALAKGMTEKAEILIRKMETSGINPDRYSYNILLKGLCKAHRLDKAFAFVSDHMEAGGFCDIISCNILIDAFCKANKVNSALKLFKEMGYKGIQANTVTYGTLINGLFSENYYNLAEELFEQMLSTNIVPNKEVSPDTVTFNTLIYWLGKNSRAIEALDLFKEMRTREVEPDSLTFKYMISGLLDEGKASLAYEV
ncbi:hypothetical protein ABZP36_000885 [Zizania latifolia]